MAGSSVPEKNSLQQGLLVIKNILLRKHALALKKNSILSRYDGAKKIYTLQGFTAPETKFNFSTV